MAYIQSKYLEDISSLLEYERLWEKPITLDVGKTIQRIEQAERARDHMYHDTYYEGLADLQLQQYDSFSDLVWRLPYDMGKHFLFSQENEMFVKGDLFEDGMNLITELPPSLMIAGALVDKFNLDTICHKDQLGRFCSLYLSQFRYTTMVQPFIPDFQYWVEQTKGLNDLHIHLNGSTETDYIWDYMLRNQYEAVSSFRNAYENNRAIRKLVEQLCPDFTPALFKEMLEHARILKTHLLTFIYSHLYDKPEVCTNIEMLWQNEKNDNFLAPLKNEILFQLFCLVFLRDTNSDMAACKFHHYLLIKGLVHRLCVMQETQVGFPQFQLLTTDSVRQGEEKTYERRFHQLLGTAQKTQVQLIEGRFSPKSNDTDNVTFITNIHKDFEKMKRCHFSEYENPAEKVPQVDLTLIAHFIKQKESESSKTLRYRHHLLRTSLRDKALALATSMKNPMFYKHVVGIDAAASEFDANPEVFAPIYRYLRRHGINHFTFHVGEDFRHLLSGMRYIYEAVDFLGLREGDRLGHCTALGIDAHLWEDRISGSCFIHQGEWLDDLIFLWGLYHDYGSKVLLPNDLIDRIESKIEELTMVIYGENYPAYLLYSVWKLRKHDPKYFMPAQQILEDGLMNYDYEELTQVIKEFNKPKIKEILDKYHAPKGELYREEYDKIIEVRTTDIISCDTLTEIQNFMLNYLAEKGIVIETLPTSNLRISFYKDIKDYHLYRWINSTDKRYMMPRVVVGSDDPGIFMTNIYNEYARIYLYLKKKGLSSVEIIEHLKKLHESSEIFKFKPKR